MHSNIPVIVTTILNPQKMQLCLKALKDRRIEALVNPSNGTGLYIAAELFEVKELLDQYID
jgi:hypothetical protein